MQIIYQKVSQAKTKSDLLDKQLKDINKEGEDRKQRIMILYRSKLKFFLKELNIDVNKVSKNLFERIILLFKKRFL